MKRRRLENEALVADLVEWIAQRPKPYAEVMEAWRSTCPRLTVWEDTLAAGLLQLQRPEGALEALVCVTPEGSRFLREVGRTS